MHGSAGEGVEVEEDGEGEKGGGDGRGGEIIGELGLEGIGMEDAGGGDVKGSGGGEEDRDGNGFGHGVIVTKKGSVAGSGEW